MKIDHLVNAVLGQVELHTAETRKTAHFRVDNALHQSAVDGGVNSVPSPAKNECAGLDRLGLRGHDHCVGPDR